MTFNAYAAQWGCDPCYDRHPRKRGDGYLFYNFSSEHQPRTVEWLKEFSAAIGRTIRECKIRPEFFQTKDIPDLRRLRKHVRDMISRLKQGQEIESRFNYGMKGAA